MLSSSALALSKSIFGLVRATNLPLALLQPCCSSGLCKLIFSNLRRFTEDESTTKAKHLSLKQLRTQCLSTIEKPTLHSPLKGPQQTKLQNHKMPLSTRASRYLHKTKTNNMRHSCIILFFSKESKHKKTKIWGIQDRLLIVWSTCSNKNTVWSAVWQILKMKVSKAMLEKPFTHQAQLYKTLLKQQIQWVCSAHSKAQWFQQSNRITQARL